MEAARDLFLREGFERTTLADVVARAGGSLATLYKLFGNKDGLLAAVLLESRESHEAIVADVRERALPPAEALHEIGGRLCTDVADAQAIEWFRVLITRGLQDESFAREFFATTIQPMLSALEELFSRWRESGIFFIGAPRDLAMIFSSVLFHNKLLDTLGHSDLFDARPEAVAARVDFFLRGAGFVPASPEQRAGKAR